MFHLLYPVNSRFFTWDELGCLCRALGFESSLFRDNLVSGVTSTAAGLPVKEFRHVMDEEILYLALHLTVNPHTGKWNLAVMRKAGLLLLNRVLSFEELYNTRVAFSTYEPHDWKGITLNNHAIIRILKLCGQNISPMLLTRWLKHIRHTFDIPGRVQLYEFLDFFLWSVVSEQAGMTVSKDSRRKQPDGLYELTDTSYLQHPDMRAEERLNTVYLKTECDYGHEILKKDKQSLHDPSLDSHRRIQQARRNEKIYRELKKEVQKSQVLRCQAKGGRIRYQQTDFESRHQRTASAPPDLSHKDQIIEMDHGHQMDTRPGSVLEIYTQLQDLLGNRKEPARDHARSEPSPCSRTFPVTPTLSRPRARSAPVIVSRDDLLETAHKIRDLEFEMATLEFRRAADLKEEHDFYLPKCKKRTPRKIWMEETSPGEGKSSTVPAKVIDKGKALMASLDERMRRLAYPKKRMRRCHAKSCDARYRGWYASQTKSGPHFIVASHFSDRSPNGVLATKLRERSAKEIQYVHGPHLYRFTIKENATPWINATNRRPHTAPDRLMSTCSNHHFEPGFHSRTSESRFNLVSSGSYGITGSESNNLIDIPGNGDEPQATFNRSDDAKTASLRQLDKYEKGIGENNIILSRNTSNDTRPEDSKEVILPRSQSSFGERLLSKTVASDYEFPVEDSHARRAEEELDISSDIVIHRSGHTKSEKSLARRSSKELLDSIPPPIMQHSKPRLIEVGSIGRISLLENIEESAHLEEVLASIIIDDTDSDDTFSSELGSEIDCIESEAELESDSGIASVSCNEKHLLSRRTSATQRHRSEPVDTRASVTGLASKSISDNKVDQEVLNTERVSEERSLNENSMSDPILSKSRDMPCNILGMTQLNLCSDRMKNRIINSDFLQRSKAVATAISMMKTLIPRSSTSETDAVFKADRTGDVVLHEPEVSDGKAFPRKTKNVRRLVRRVDGRMSADLRERLRASSA